AIVTDTLLIHPGARLALGDGIGYLLLDHFGHRLLDGVGDLTRANGAFLECAAWAFALAAFTLGINISAANLASHRIGDLLLDDFSHLPVHCVGDLATHVFVHGGRARNHFVDGLRFPDLAGAHLVGFPAGDTDALDALFILAGARIEAALAAFLPA